MKKAKIISALFSIIVFLVFLCLGCNFLKEALQIDLGMSWVILTLMSMLTLSYVDLTNRLRDMLRREELKYPKKYEASFTAVFLTWTGVYLFIAIIALTLRITWLFFHKPVPLWVDEILIASFLTSTLMRIGIFLYSYWDNFLGKHFWS